MCEETERLIQITEKVTGTFVRITARVLACWASCITALLTSGLDGVKFATKIKFRNFQKFVKSL